MVSSSIKNKIKHISHLEHIDNHFLVKVFDKAIVREYDVKHVCVQRQKSDGVTEIYNVSPKLRSWEGR